ncbi:MAG TPA: hypothetical protein DET40_03135 [Lentisphaeria bacterium]|nr:MAG: hypothetical protein A2X45_22355 [Lentisphaerae bacterium GWF2_50_93]HCE42525.1 hypothetical protein [Lentisphaeria bacterium]
MKRIFASLISAVVLLAASLSNAAGPFLTVDSADPVKGAAFGSTFTMDGELSPINAVPNPGYHFVNWTITSGTATITDENSRDTTASITADATVTANFAINSNTAYPIVFNTVGQGLATSGTVIAYIDEWKEISATAQPGSMFVNWSGVNVNFEKTDSPETRVQLASGGDGIVTANFAPGGSVFTLTPVVSGSGIVTPSRPVSIYANGPVSISAEAGPGYHFVNWTADAGATVIDASSPQTFVKIVLVGDKTVTANFAPNIEDYTLTMACSPLSGGMTNGTTVSAAAGEPTLILATAAPGSHFVNWTAGAGATIIDANSPETYARITADATVTANFAYNKTIFMTPVVSGSGTMTPDPMGGALTLEAGVTVPLIATPDPLFRFVNWTALPADAVIFETGAENFAHSGVKVIGDVTLTANFAAMETADLTLEVLPPLSANIGTLPVFPGGPVYTIEKGLEFQLIAIPEVGNRFVQWNITGSASIGNIYSNDTWAVINGDATLTAVTSTTADVFAGTEPYGAGTLEPGGLMSVTIGTPQDITATAGAGYVFDYWESTGGVVVDAPGIPVTFITAVTGNGTVTAHFRTSQAALHMSSLPAVGGFTSPSLGVTFVNTGVPIPISAAPIPGYVFQNWATFMNPVPGINDVTASSTSIELAAWNEDVFANALFAPSFQWAKRSTGDYSELRSMKADAAGNVLVAGRMGDNTTFGSFTLTRAGSQDMFIARYNSSGTCTMAINPASSTSDNINPKGLAVDSLGNIYVGGTYTSDLTFADGTLPAGSESHFVAKFNSAGVLQWKMQINEISTSSEWLVSDTEGNVYLTGSFMSPTILTIGLNSETANPTGALWNSFLAKLDTDGNCAWIRTAGTDGIEVHSLAVAVTPDGSNSVIGGYVANPGLVAFEAHNITSVNESRMFLAVYDASGTCVNAMNSESTTSGAASLMALDIDAYGNTYFAGVNMGAISLAGIALPDDLSASDEVNIGKIAPDGTGMWMKQLPMLDSMAPTVSLAVDGVGNAYVTSLFNFSLPEGARFGEYTLFDSHGGLYLAKYDANGECMLAKKVTTVYSGTDRDYGIDNDASGNMYMAGMINGDGVNLDVDTFISSNDVFIARLPAADNYANLTLVLGTADSAQISPMVGTMSVLKGEPFTISADISKGYHFVNWDPTSGAPVIGDAALVETTVTLSDDATVTLNASLNTGTFYNAYVYTNGQGSVYPNGPVQVYSDEWKEISATANPGYHFVEWIPDGAGATFGKANLPETRMRLTADNVNVEATFAADGAAYTLTPAVSGSGTTTPEHPVLVSVGEPWFITAEAGNGYHFVNWTVTSGAATFADSASPETYATLTENSAITANFTPNTTYYNLTIVSDPVFGGMTNATTVAVAAGEPYKISATANDGYHFVSWTSPANATFTDQYMSTTYVRLTGDATVTVHFATSQTAFITMAASGDGTVTPTGRTAFSAGETVQITATSVPAISYFVNWTSTDGRVTFANAGLPQTTITVYGDDTVTANFAPTGMLNLTLTTDGNGSTAPAENTPTPYSKGDAISIAATPHPGYRFASWGSISGTGGTISDLYAQSTTVYLAGTDMEYRAFFSSLTTLTVTTEPKGAGTVTPATPQEVTPGIGTWTPITATPLSGYEFVEWRYDTNDTDIQLAGQFPSTTVSIGKPATITAVFKYSAVTLNMASLPAFGGTTDPGTGPALFTRGMVDIPISAIPVGGWVFQNWDNVVTGGTAIADLLSPETSVTLGPMEDEADVTAFFAPAFQWAERTTGDSSNEPRSIKTDPDGNAIVAGVMSLNATFGTTSLALVGAQDIYIAKYNSSGTCTMAVNPASCDTLNGFILRSMALDSSGNIYMAGDFTGRLTFGAEPPLDSIVDSSFVAKFDPSGAVQWAIQFENAELTSECLAVDNSGHAYLTGFFMTTPLAIVPETVNPVGASANVFLAKIDGADGSCQWLKGVGADTIMAYGLAVAVAPDGKAAIGGALSGLGQISFGDITLQGDMQWNMFVAAYDSDGSCLMAINSIGGEGVSARALNFDASGNLYFTGTYMKGFILGDVELDDISSPMVRTNIGKISSAGVVQWIQKMSADDPNSNMDLAVDSSGNAYLSAAFSTGSVDLGNIRIYSPDIGICLAKYNTDGVCLFAKKIMTYSSSATAPGNPRNYGIDVDAGGNLYMAGWITVDNLYLDAETFISIGSDTFLAKLPGADSYAYLTLALGTADSAEVSPMIGTMSVLKGEPFNISAEVAKGYHLVNWTSTSGSPAIADASALDTTVTLTGDATVTLKADLNTGTFYNLSMDLTGSGSVSPSCVVYSDEWKEISATASAGSHFVGWTNVGGATFGSANSPMTSVKLTADATVTAEFAFDGASYTLTPAISGSGSTQPSHPVLVSSGEPMPITAEAGAGYHFVNWTAGAGSTIVDASSPETYATLTASATITANFSPNTAYYNLTIVSSPTFGGTTMETTVAVASGEPCQISATAAEGYHFTGWTSPANTTFVDANLPTTYVRLSGDATVTANFATNQTVFLTMAASGAGTVTPSSRTALSVGESQQITAIPTDPITTCFVNWSMSGNAIFENTGLPQTNVVLYGDSTVTAYFAAGGMADLTVAVVPALSGTTNPAEGVPMTYDKGEVINLEAYPEAGFKFLNWSINSGNVSIADGNSAFTTAYMTSNASITANFTNTATLTVLSEPAGAGTVTPASPQSLTINDPIPTPINAMPNSGYEFIGWTWSGPATISDDMLASTDVVIMDNASVTANFRYTQATLHMASLPTVGGTTNPPAGTSTINRMEDVPISATPIAGYTFQNWARPECIGGIWDLTSANTIINLDIDDDEAFVTAFFAPSFKWAKRSDGGMSVPRSVKTDAAGNVFVAGTMAGNTSFGSFNLTWVSGQDLFIAKYDSAGACTMAFNPASSMSDISPTGLAVDSTGNIYVGGSFTGDVMFGATPLTDIHNSHFVAKFNSSGVLQWVEQIDEITTTSEWLVADTAGNVYLTGTLSMPTLTISDVTVNRIGMKSNSFLAKLDTDGNCTWIKTAGGSIDVDVLSLAVAVDADGNTAIGGTLSPGIDEVSFGDFDLEGDMTKFRMFIATYDASGTCLSAMNSTGGNASAVALDFDVDGNLYFAGKNEGNISLGGVELPDDWRWVSEANIGKISSSGNVAWMQQLQSLSDNVSLAVDGSGDVFVSSAFDAAPEGTAFGEITLFDMDSGLYVAKYDATGGCLFAKKVVSTSSISGFDRAFGIDIDASGNLLMTGRITNPDPVDLDVDVFTSDSDVFIAKLPGAASYANLTLALGTADSADVKPMVGTMAVLKGEPFNISAEISTGYHFVNWTKSSSLAILEDSTALETTVTLTGDATVTLNAALNTATFYDLTMAVSGSGTSSPSGIVQVYSDEWTDISATAQPGFHFVNWTKTAGATLGSANSPETRVKLTSNATVTAIFDADGASFTLTPAVTGSGSTEPAHPVLVTSGEPTLILAEAGAGYHFVNWTKTAGTIVDANSPVTYATLTGNATITANFAENSAVYCRLSQVASPSYGGTVEGGIITLASGEPCQISATAAAGYHFTGWTAVENATFTDAYVSPTYVRLTGDSTVTANFAPNQTVFLTTAVSGLGSVTPTGRNALSVGESQQITAVPTDILTTYFAGWTVSGNATVANAGLANTSVVLTGDATVTANFAAIGTADLTMTVAGYGTTMPVMPLDPPMTFNKGEPIFINAMPDPGNRFLYWTIMLGDAAIDDLNSANTTAYITGNATINATFSSQATLTMFTEPAGAGTVSPGATQVIDIDNPPFTIPTPIVATANSGYEFIGWTWSGPAAISDDMMASTDVTISDNASVTAHFRYTQATLHLGVLPSAGGTTDPAAGIVLVNRNEPVGLTATFGAGYVFQNWDNLQIMAPMDIASPSANIMLDDFTDEASVNAIFAPSFQWAKRTAGDANNEPRGIKTDSSGSAIVTGVMSSNVSFGMKDLTFVGPGQDIYLATYSPGGSCTMAANPASSDTTISARTMAVDSSGNIYVAGDFSGTATFGALPALVSTPGGSIFITKINSSGTVQWVRQVNDAGINSGSLAVDSSGNVYITGMFWIGPLTIESKSVNQVGIGTNVFLAKLDSSGVCQWLQGAGSSDDVMPINAYVTSVAVNPLGGVSIGGYIMNLGTVDFGDHPVSNTRDYSSFIAEYDASGNCLDAIGASGEALSGSYIMSMKYDNVGNLYFAGVNYGGMSLGGFDLPDDMSGIEKFHLGKLGSDWNTQWIKQLSVADGIDSISIAVDAAGNAYVCAYFDSASGADFGAIKLYDISNGLFIAKFNASGVCSYAKKVLSYNSADPRNFGIDVDAGGNLFMAGRIGIDNVNLDVENFISTDSDTFIARIAGSGSAVMTMAVLPVSTGTVTPPAGNVTVLKGEPINISAEGVPGYDFVNWTKSTYAAVTNVNASVTTATLTADSTVTANFAKKDIILTMAKVGQGTTSPVVGDIAKKGATAIAITATPATGYHFVEWEVIAGSADIVDTSDPTTTLTMYESSTIQALFEINTYDVTFTAGANGTLAGTSPQTVNHGSDCTLVTATPAAGYHFVNWKKGTTIFSTDAALTVTNVTAAADLVANFAINTYAVTFTAGANGSITGTKAQIINHNADCTAVTAVPAANYHFTGWTGDHVGVENPLTLTGITAITNVTANFARDTGTLTMAETGNGDATFTGANPVNTQTLIPIVAVADQYNHFVNWTVTGSATVTSLTTASTTVKLTGAHGSAVTITANFALNTTTLTMAKSGNGGVTPAVGANTVNMTDNVDITATPDANHHFVNWTKTVNPANVVIPDVNDATTTATLTGPATVTATFARDTATLTINPPVNGNAEFTGANPLNTATAVPITAIADENYHFVNWTLDAGLATIADANSAATTVTLDGLHASSVTLSANFAHDQANLTMVANGDGTTTPVAGASVVDTATAVNISAADGVAGVFTNWTVTGNATLGAAATTNANTVTLMGDATVTANFYDSSNDLTPPADSVGIAGAAESSTVYRIVNVPVGTTYMKVWTTDAGGATVDDDCDIYVKPGEIPSTTDYYAKSTRVGWEELIEVTSPIAGDWYILVYGYDAYANVNLNIECSSASVPMKPLTLTASDDQTDRVNVEWTIDAGDGAFAYQVYRSTVNSPELALPVGAPVLKTVATTYQYPDIFPAVTYCQYYYWVKAMTNDDPPLYSAFSESKEGSNTVASTETVIKSGTAVTLSGVAGSIRKYKITVPASSATVPLSVLLDIRTSKGTGDCDLEVLRETTTELKYSRNPGNAELVRYDPPTDGATYIISVIGKSAYTGVSLVAKLYTKAPVVPTLVTASDGTYPDKIIVTWKDVEAASMYEVWRHDAKITVIANIATTATKIAETPDSSFVDNSPLDDIKTYYYWVRAKNSTLGPSLFSANNSGYVSRVPVAPTAITASDATFFDKIVVTWPKVLGATSYLLYRGQDDTDPLNATLIETIDAVSTTITYKYEDMGDDLDLASIYYYWVKSQNDNGASVLFSKYDSGKLKNVAPATVTASDGTFYMKVKITWAAVPGATSYNVYRTDDATLPDPKPVALVANTTSTFAYDDTMVDGTKYFYWVDADYNNVYQSKLSLANSGYAATTIPATLAAPVMKTASKGEYSFIRITWAEVPLAEDYMIYRKGPLDLDYGLPIASNVTDLFYVDSDGALVPGTSYSYRVKANNGTAGKVSLPSAAMSGYAGMATTTDLDAITDDMFTVAYTDTLTDSTMFKITNVPVGTTRLVATAENQATGDGDCDIFAKFNTFPTTTVFNAKGVETIAGGITKDLLVVANPMPGTWYVLFQAVKPFADVDISIRLYSRTDVVLTQTPVDNMVAPFKPVFKGKVVDQDNKGIKDVVVQVRDPIKKTTAYLTTKTDVNGIWTYTANITCEGEHTFDFFVTSFPESGSASWTVKTRKSSMEENKFFDMAEYLSGTVVDLGDAANLDGMQTYLNIRRGFNEAGVVDDGIEAKWYEDTISAASSDTKITDRLDSGLYFLLYGFEGAAAGNAVDKGFNLTATPLLVHVAPGVNQDDVIANLLDQGLVDNVFVQRVNDGGIGVVVVSAINIAGKKSGLLLAKEQIEVLANIAGNTGLTNLDTPEKLGTDTIVQTLSSEISGGAADIGIYVGSFSK